MLGDVALSSTAIAMCDGLLADSAFSYDYVNKMPFYLVFSIFC